MGWSEELDLNTALSSFLCKYMYCKVGHVGRKANENKIASNVKSKIFNSLILTMPAYMKTIVNFDTRAPFTKTV